MNREAVLQQMRAQRAALTAILDTATDDELRHAPPGRWSAEGILRHLIDFEEDVLNGIAELEAGQPASWTQIRDWNQRNAARALEWPSKPVGEIRAALEAHRQAVEGRLLTLPEEQAADPRYLRGFFAVSVHDYEHVPGICERLAQARGDLRRAAIHYAEITRRELLAFLPRIPLEAYDERLPGKWSIKEILIHLAVRDRMWTEIIRRVSAGGGDEWPHTADELDSWNQREVAKLAHLPPQMVLHALGEARGEWNIAMLAVPDHMAAEERYRSVWAERRMRHDRHHLPQLGERLANWRNRQSK